MTTASNAELREHWLEYCTVVSYLEQVCLLYRHWCISVSYKNEYLMVDSGAYLCTNMNLHREVEMVSD